MFWNWAIFPINENVSFFGLNPFGKDPLKTYFFLFFLIFALFCLMFSYFFSFVFFSKKTFPGLTPPGLTPFFNEWTSLKDRWLQKKVPLVRAWPSRQLVPRQQVLPVRAWPTAINRNGCSRRRACWRWGAFIFQQRYSRVLGEYLGGCRLGSYTGSWYFCFLVSVPVAFACQVTWHANAPGTDTRKH